MNDRLIAIYGVWLNLETAVITRARRDERGSVTMEQVMWAVAVIAIVGVVVAAITSFVNTKSALIK